MKKYLFNNVEHPPPLCLNTFDACVTYSFYIFEIHTVLLCKDERRIITIKRKLFPFLELRAGAKLKTIDHAFPRNMALQDAFQ